MKCLTVIAIVLLMIIPAVSSDVSICDVNQGIGVQSGDIITVTGICTMPSERYGDAKAIITQDGGGPWCSIGIYDSEATLDIQYGDCVTVTGEFHEYYELNEIVISSLDSVWGCGLQIPDPIRVIPPVDLESLENCTVVFEGVTIQSDPDQYGNITLEDRYGSEWKMLMRIADPIPAVGSEFCSLKGIMDYHFGEHKLRLINDDSIDQRPHDDCPWMGTACDDVKIHQFLGNASESCFQPDDLFHYTVTWTNLCSARGVYALIVMDINGEYFFFPQWSSYMNLEITQLPELGSVWWNVLEFTYPGGAAGISAQFWAAALDPVTMALVSDLAHIEFCLD